MVSVSDKCKRVLVSLIRSLALLHQVVTTVTRVCELLALGSGWLTWGAQCRDNSSYRKRRLLMSLLFVFSGLFLS